MEPGAQRLGVADRASPRASTRNVAWAASCASWRSPIRSRHTRRTVGPCRSTSAAKAASDASSGPIRNRSRSCASVRLPIAPTSHRSWIPSSTPGKAADAIGSAPSRWDGYLPVVPSRAGRHFRIPERISGFTVLLPGIPFRAYRIRIGSTSRSAAHSRSIVRPRGGMRSPPPGRSEGSSVTRSAGGRAWPALIPLADSVLGHGQECQVCRV